MHPGQTALRRAMVAVMAASLVFAFVGVAGSAPVSEASLDGEASTRINVNTASSSELQALPGIGPKKAGAIVAYREANGPFKRVDDLVEVKGIGPKTLAKLRPLVTCGGKARPEQRPRRGR